MNVKKLKKIEIEMERMRSGTASARDLEAVAIKLGRLKSNRGKEPTWISKHFSNLRPVSIPHHGNKDLKHGTKNSILNDLEEDLFSWYEEIGN